MTVELRAAEPDDLEAVETLLERYGLPTADLRDGDATISLAEADGAIAGVGGLEIEGSVGLLRSVAVAEQGQGYGSAICDRLESRASKAGVETLYLLTETAAGFFAGRGYERVDRDAAPAAIKATTEFSELCGESAVCLHKPL